ncbi:MAG: ester cyclase [Actinobacteria bacterium]|nr:ester cyclase [Actinomycetota bacterium]
MPGGLSPAGAADYGVGLFTAFPDLAFEVGSRATGEDGLVTATWRMTGTNRGPFMGLPPTGRTVDLRGVDVIAVERDRVRSVEGHFDTRLLPEQLGLHVIVQPAAIGPFEFGVSAYVPAADAEPGAVSLTVLEARWPDEIEEVRGRSRDVVLGILETPGFISWIGVTVGSRMFTLTACRARTPVPAAAAPNWTRRQLVGLPVGAVRRPGVPARRHASSRRPCPCRSYLGGVCLRGLDAIA